MDNKSMQKWNIPEPPVHYLSSLVTIVLDMVWSVIEIPAALSVSFLPAVLPISLATGLMGLAAVTLVQKYVAKDSFSVAFSKGLVLGIFAGVPFPVTGTAVGTVLLTWTGVYNMRRKSLPTETKPGNNPTEPASVAQTTQPDDDLSEDYIEGVFEEIEKKS